VAVTIGDRYHAIQNIINSSNAKRNFIYLDETSFNNFIIPLTCNRLRRKPVCDEVQPQFSNKSVLAAFSDGEVIPFQIFEKSVTGQDFGAFMVDLMNQENLKERGLDGYMFFMNNLPYRKQKVG